MNSTADLLVLYVSLVCICHIQASSLTLQHFGTLAEDMILYTSFAGEVFIHLLTLGISIF